MKKITFKPILLLVFILCSFCITAQSVLPNNETFRLRNVATGQFLTTAGGSTQPVTMTNLAEDDISTHWTFVVSGAYYNIDSKIETGGTGILRVPGTGGTGGPYVVVSTTKAPPAADTDKVWTIQHNQTDDTYRFKSGTSGIFMYHDANGTVTHVVVSETDDRSNWELIPFIETPVETAPDEDTGSYTTCNADGANATRTSYDLPNPVNVGTIDDRSCYANYKESNVNGKTWGIYNITHNSNKFDATLQPRIERALSPSNKTGIGSFAKFTGVFRILETGDTSGTNSDGSYIAQAKGKHTGGGGSPDPAICLYLAKPVYGTGANSGKQVSFNIYAERIKYRGGSGSGREIVFLKNVLKNEETSFELEIGFKQDPNDPSKKIQYCNAIIGGTVFNWDVPEPERATQSKIRYGAYRVKGGRAQIRWANTTYQKAEVDNQSLSIEDNQLNLSSIKTYPNPANENFTIQLDNLNNASISIFNIIGKRVYQKLNVKESIQIINNNRFKSGMYLIKVIDSNQKVYFDKLIIN